MADRPARVPDDWILVDCENPGCDMTVWVPDIGPVEYPVLKVCSAECAKGFVDRLR